MPRARSTVVNTLSGVHVGVDKDGGGGKRAIVRTANDVSSCITTVAQITLQLNS